MKLTVSLTVNVSDLLGILAERVKDDPDRIVEHLASYSREALARVESDGAVTLGDALLQALSLTCRPLSPDGTRAAQWVDSLSVAARIRAEIVSAQ